MSRKGIHFIVVGAVTLACGLFALHFVVKRGHMHTGYFRILDSSNGSTQSEVDMSGFVAFHLVVAPERGLLATSLVGSLEIMSNDQLLDAVRLNEAKIVHPKVAALVQSESAFLLGGRGIVLKDLPSGSAALHFRLHCETDSVPLSVWVGYPVPGFRVPWWRDYVFHDRDAEASRVKPIP
jgi:hypothetical protein